jgi:hypothetical protein
MLREIAAAEAVGRVCEHRKSDGRIGACIGIPAPVSPGGGMADN